MINLILLLILLNAFFVASEMALVSARKTRLEEMTKKKSLISKYVKNTNKNINFFITATQFGSTLTSIAVGWVSQDVISTLFHTTLKPLLIKLPILNNTFFTTLLPFLLITFLIMTLGELLPKKIIMINPEKSTIFLALPLTLFSSLFSPIIRFFNHITDAFLKFFGRRSNTKQTPFSENELKIIIEQSVKDDVIPKSLRIIIFNTLKLKKTKSVNIMVDISKMKTFWSSDTLEVIQQRIARENLLFVRFPVIHHKSKKIIGFIELSDFIKALTKFDKKTVLEKTPIIKQAITISDEKTIDEVFSEMLNTKTHLAVVNGKNNSPQGVITIGDIAGLLTKQ